MGIFTRLGKGLLSWACAAVLLAAASALPAPAHAQAKKVTWDNQSLFIDGKREIIWSGEFHPFRLPDTNGWRDVYRKMKASGFNTVALYFYWGYHSPAPGVYDFTGIRDMDLAIRMAEEEGLYVIVRPGPYINAELSRGGFPGYLARQTAVARTDDPAYLKEADAWLTAIDAIIAKHQITRGGKVILYQVENELFDTSDVHRRYMDHLIKKVRADGIDVPLFHNSPNRLPNWTPANSGTYYTVAAPGLDLYAYDGYPGGNCENKPDPGSPPLAPNYGIYGENLPAIGSLASPKTPGFAAEYGAGWFDYWGSIGNYECNARRMGPGYVRTVYGADIINRITIHNVFLAFGGTTWGWLPASVVYTSYDYGAFFAEDRSLRDKAYAMKQLGQFVQAAEPLVTEMDKAEPLYPTSDKVKLYHNAGPAGHLVFAIHNPSDGIGDDPFKFRLTTKAGSYLIPQAGTLRMKGHDAKLLVADYALERQALVYTTSDLQTHLRQGAGDIALLYGRHGEDGETVLRFKTAPRVEVLEGRASSTFDAATGDLRLNYVHDGLIRVRITGAGAPLLLLIGDDAAAQGFWRQDTDKGAVLQRSAPIVTGAAWSGETLALTGVAYAGGPIEVWAPARAVTFNGAPLTVRLTSSGSLLTSAVAGPAPVSLPDLTRTQWTLRRDSPEADPAFDDSAWRAADLKVSAATGPTQPPAGQPVLAMSDYGFHQGDVWYRGRLTARTTQRRLELRYGGGAVGLVQVWIDGRFVGQDELPGGNTYPDIPTVGTAVFDVDLAPGEHQISVMVRNMSHNWDLFANEEHKEARGLIHASLSADDTTRFDTPIAWKIMGQGEVMDPVRGPLNNGGLYGERNGWHLPQAPAQGWTPAALTVAPPGPGTYWLRTTARLDLPAGQDVQLGLAFGDRSKTKTDRQTRVMIFVNGWHLGNYVSHVGPQNTFVIPPGLLVPNGDNVIALAVTTDGKPGNALESVRLVDLRAGK
jgi:beta-galactosidase GanA